MKRRSLPGKAVDQIDDAHDTPKTGPSADGLPRLERRSFLQYAATLPALYWSGGALAQTTPKPPNPLLIGGQPGPIRPPAVGSPAIVPNASRTVWNPGIYGSIPPDSAELGVFPNGVGPAIQHGSTISAGASSSTIQSALNAAGAVATKASRRFVQLGPGNFFSISGLSIPSYVILRGTSTGVGNRQTMLEGTSPMIQMQGAGNGSNWGTIANVVGVAYQGDSTITVDNASSISVGDIISIDHESDGSAFGPANGNSSYDPPNDSDYVWWLDSEYYQRTPYSNGHGTHFLGPDTSFVRHVAQRCEVLRKNGNTLTIYDPPAGRGAPLHTTFYKNPEVYRCAGAYTDVVRYAGVEDLILKPFNYGGNETTSLNGAAFCWVKNVESDGSGGWSGRHMYLRTQTYRCEIRECYVHESANYNSGGNAYGINIQGSENLIENNVVRQLNKPITLVCSNGGNVIAYNYVDEAVIQSLTNSWQEAGIGTHESFCHHELFEGNLSPTIGPDSQGGNNGWNTIFRNHVFGSNSSGHTNTFMRCIEVQGWNLDVVSIGNVLTADNDLAKYQIAAATSPADQGAGGGIGYQTLFDTGAVSMYAIGFNAWTITTGGSQGADAGDNGMSWSNFHRHLDWDEVSGSQYTNPANPVTDLPNSLYLQSKPAFFGSFAWPWVDPTGSSRAQRVKTLPAKARYDAGNA